jgi:hypothetical protein
MIRESASVMLHLSRLSWRVSCDVTMGSVRVFNLTAFGCCQVMLRLYRDISLYKRNTASIEHTDSASRSLVKLRFTCRLLILIRSLWRDSNDTNEPKLRVVRS